MSTPAEYYNSLPPVTKFYGVTCLLASGAHYLQLYDPSILALVYSDVYKGLQVWRLVTNFFFLGPFSHPFALCLITIARYGVELERGPFNTRTADYLWMLIFGAFTLLAMAMVPGLCTPFMGPSLVYMMIYVWSREFPDAPINIYGVVTLKGFYLPLATLALELIFEIPLKPAILGMVAGHAYYYLTVLYPLAGGRYDFRTPLWVHKLVAFCDEGTRLALPAGIAFLGIWYCLLTENDTHDHQM